MLLSPLSLSFLSYISGSGLESCPWDSRLEPGPGHPPAQHSAVRKEPRVEFLMPPLDFVLWKVSGVALCGSWGEGGTQTYHMVEAGVGVWGWVLHSHGGRGVADLGPILIAVMWHHGWHGRIGIGVGPAEVLRVGLCVVALCRGLQERLVSGSGP